MTEVKDTSGEFRGYDDEGHRVVVGWVNKDGSEYLIGLTFCCQATSKATEAGIVCRACYDYCEMSLAGEARLAKDVHGNPLPEPEFPAGIEIGTLGS